MRCNICKQYLDRGTSTKPNNYCDDCLNKYVKIEVIKQTSEEIIKWYTDIINSCIEEIKKCKKTIEENETLIEFAKQQINM